MDLGLQVTEEKNLQLNHGDILRKKKTKSLQRDNFKFYGPAGTVYCNLHDWNKFLKTQVAGFNGLDTEVLKAESFKKLFSAYPDDKISYTFGGWF